MSDIFSNMQIPYSTTTQKTETPEVAPQTVTVKESIPASNVKEQPSDTVELSTTQPKKKGPIKSLKGFIANVKKFFATTGEYVKGTAKGIVSGAVAGSVVYTAGAVINGARQGVANRTARKAGEEVAQVVKKIPNKPLAILVGGIALAASIWNASLNATEKSSNIDHRWTGHQ